MNARKLYQHKNEPFNDFLARVKIEVNKCQGTQLQLNDFMIEIITDNCISQRLQEKIIGTENITLDQVINLGRLDDTLSNILKQK